MQVAPPTPQAARGLPAVRLDMAELLAVVTLCQASLGSVCLHLDNNVAQIGQFEYSLGFFCSWECHQEQWKICSWVPPSLVVLLDVICLTFMMSKPKSTKAFYISFAGVSERRCLMTGLMGFSGFGKTVK
jgi:hypothetical protein